MSGRSLPRPINYSLLAHPAAVRASRPIRANGPVVVIDPRAGQGPGIGGFKAESEIGDALERGPSRLFHRLQRRRRNPASNSWTSSRDR